MLNYPLIDKILAELMTATRMMGTADLAARLGEEQEEVVRNIYFVTTARPNFLKVTKGSGDHQLYVIRQQKHELEMKAFLKAGGFTILQAEEQKAKGKDEKIKDLQIENLPVATAQAKQAMKDSKRSVTISIISTIIALLSLALAAIALWQSKE